MRQIYEYLPKPQAIPAIKATNETIREIVNREIRNWGVHQDLNYIDVSEVTDMSSLFEGIDFQGDVSKWNVGKLENASRMFLNCKSFNCDISRWDVRMLKDAESMFSGCEKFNCDLSDWRIDKLENMRHMFFKCYEFNCDLSEWNVKNVRNLDGAFYMCRSLMTDLSKWDIHVSADLYATFYKCKCMDFNMKRTKWEQRYNNATSGSKQYMLVGSGFTKKHLSDEMANAFNIKK